MTTATVSIRAEGSVAPPRDVVTHVFGDDRVLDGRAARLAGLIDARFLAECGWDRVRLVLAPPADHPHLRWREPVNRPVPRTITCAVPRCRRRPTGDHGLCRSHRRGQVRRRVAVEEFATDPARQALTHPGICQVAACPRDRNGSFVGYCEPHQDRWLDARKATAGLDETRWRLVSSPIPVTGQVSLAGLPPLIVAQVLYGLQQRIHAGGHARIDVLRLLVEELRRAQVDDVVVAAEDPPGEMRREKRRLLDSLAWHVRLAITDPEAEKAKDVWELAVFGLRGRLCFTGITQRWLRESVKRWAADELPRHRGSGVGNVMRSLVGCMVRLSRSLHASRPDHGNHPADLERGDIESLLHRLAYLASVGELSPELRAKTCRNIKRVLDRIRALRLTRPGGPAAGLGDDFTLASGDIPAEPERGEPGRDLPLPIVRQLCQHLSRLENGQPSSREIRLAVELLIDTGRRPEEILRLPHDCVAHDPDGAATLVYDNHKRDRRDRTLPISQTTSALIIAQQRRVHERFPDTPRAELALLPTSRANPSGRKPISGGLLDLRHRTWVDQLPALRLDDGTEFDKAKIVPYAYRHTYAQRHADAGIPIDVLAKLLDHRNLDVSRRYYRIEEGRRRAAVDKVTTLSFDRHGNRLWRDAQTLLESEHTRYAVGEVAVPYGRCREPSNVQAGGGACPVRFRCAGCDHFRTDVAFLPDLTTYLDDLLRTRERLAATIEGVDEWARADATPTDEEITRIRRLINRIKNDIAELDQVEQTEINDAVAVVRRHRAAHAVALGMPGLRPTDEPLTTITSRDIA
jgi:integrase